jgi:hypothetical protein
MQHSPLLDLPGEIRNCIYDYVFTVGTYTFTRQITHSRLGRHVEYITSRLPVAHSGNISPEVALTYTCRQIYSESKLLSFMLNTFYFNSLRTFNEMRSYFTTEQLHAIKRFHTKTLYCHPDYQIKEVFERVRRDGHTFSSLLPGVGHVTVDSGVYFDMASRRNNDLMLQWLTQKDGITLEIRIGRYVGPAMKVEDFVVARSQYSIR